MTQQEEAILIFDQVIKNLSSRNRDLKSAMRLCQHACQLVTWDKQEKWFKQELQGYPADIPVPSYRKVRGQLEWRALGSERESIYYAVDKSMNGAPLDTTNDGVILDVRGGIDWILLSSQNGCENKTNQTQMRWIDTLQKSIKLDGVHVFPSSGFINLITQIEGFIFDFASQSYRILCYGNMITDIWQDYRRQVEATLSQLGFSQHLDAIQSGLMSDNSESWRSSVFECRNLLSDVANYLWRDKREEYVFLKGDGPHGKLKVTQDRTANRLRAYVHQKILGEKNRKYIESEIDRLADSIRFLLGYQSIAHAPVNKKDARAVALATYFVLGELIVKTDMIPIEKYGNPAVSFQLGENEDVTDE